MTAEGAVSDRTMILKRRIDAPLDLVWQAWTDPAILPQWWGPNGFSCKTYRMDLRTGGEWLFDMIGPDGTVYPNHHTGLIHDPQSRIAYVLRWGENGPKHADAQVTFASSDQGTEVTLAMEFLNQAEHDGAKAFGAYELGLETLGKLAAAVAR